MANACETNTRKVVLAEGEMGQPPPEHPVVVNLQEVHLTEEENISQNSRMTWFKGIGPNLRCTSGGRAHASGVRR